jgi:hypothetical protein
MKCDEFQRILPELEGGHSLEQEEHLKTCSRCSDLVADLSAIAQQARLLADDEDPSPRVWNRLEIALRQEGLIRGPQSAPSPARTLRWSPAWLVPLAASFLVIFGLLLYQRGGIQPQSAQQLPVTSPAVTASLQPEGMSAEQDELLKIVAARAPGLRSAYESEFKAVNAYIRDAELSARRNPNDEISQQYLTNAYEQRAMVYEMAMDRGLP